MRVLIVDDEPPALWRLQRLLGAFPDVEIIATAGDGEEALRCVEVHNPEVIFLDVQMPGVSGLDVAASLPERAPAIVFVTAFEHYALSAFDAAASDYLLKPVSRERLATCLQRIRNRASGARCVTYEAPKHLLIPDRGKTHVVSVSDISWLEAADNYVVVHASDRAPLLRRSLGGLLNDLGGDFLRVHRGAAISVDKVIQIQPRGRGDALISLKGGIQVPCSRQYRASLIERFSSTPSLM